LFQVASKMGGSSRRPILLMILRLGEMRVILDLHSIRQTNALDLPSRVPRLVASINSKETTKTITFENAGAPRPMKMGTIASRWHYDAGACRAIRSGVLRSTSDFVLRLRAVPSWVSKSFAS
jgi:hypothetical protein